jgi:FtsH-binding integral membrane protein
MGQYNGSIVQGSERGAIQAFMAQIYGWMSVGLLLTALVAWYAIPADMYSVESITASLAYKIGANSTLRWGLVIAQLGIVFGLSLVIHRLSASVATGLFMLYSVLTGLTLSMLVFIYTQQSIASTLFITAGMFGAMTVYGYVTKKDLSGIGNFLIMGLFGIILASIVNIFMQNSALTMAISYIGVVVFVGLTAYDTQKLKNLGEEISEDDPENYRKYSILGALTLYLDFINLFIMLLRILGDRR